MQKVLSPVPKKPQSPTDELQKLRNENLELRYQIKKMKDWMFNKEQEWKREERRLTTGIFHKKNLDHSNYHKGVKHQIYLKFKDQIFSLRRQNKENIEKYTHQIHQTEKITTKKYSKMESNYILKINDLYSLVEEK